MSSTVYRFRVKNQLGDESQDWRIWAQGDNIYAGPRHTTNVHKASFHASGECHVGLTAEARKSLANDVSWTGKSRNFSTWTVDPSDIDGNPQHLVLILFPDSFLGVPGTPPDSKTVVLESNAATITTISVLRTRSNEHVQPTSDAADFSVLFRTGLPSGRDIVVARWTRPETAEYRAAIKSQFMSHFLAQRTVSGRTYGAKPEGALRPSMRAMLWDGSDSNKYWSEVSALKLMTWEPDIDRR